MRLEFPRLKLSEKITTEAIAVDAVPIATESAIKEKTIDREIDRIEVPICVMTEFRYSTKLILRGESSSN